MELRQLRYFLAVAEELHFGRAAKRLHLSQPPLSQQIRALEDEIQVRLFDRTSRRVELTPAGAALLEETRAVLARIDQAVERARGVARGNEGYLQVGFVTMAMDAFLPQVLSDFSQQHPRITLTLNEMGTNAQLRALRAGELHAGFPRLYEHDLVGLEHELVLREPYLLAVPEDHALAGLGRITLPSLEGVNLILSPRHVQPRVYDRIVATCRHAGFSPRITHEAMSRRSSLALVAAGMGVSLVTASTGKVSWPGVVYRQLEPDWPPVEIALVWPAGARSPGLDALLNLVRRHRRLEIA